MKSVFSWICDPLLHVIVIVFTLVWLTRTSGPSSVSGPGLVHCQTCHEAHEPEEARCVIVGALSGMMGASE
ncbi:MAG: hypothetical protein AB7I30_11255 [Isosphaeraceae bacterium]